MPMTNIGDKWLGDPYYFPLGYQKKLLQSAQGGDLHPSDGADLLHQSSMAPEINDSVIEFATDTSRAIGRMLFSGAAHRFPDIKFIFSHAGGTMPYILERYTRHPLAESEELNLERVPNGVIKLSASASITTRRRPRIPSPCRRSPSWSRSRKSCSAPTSPIATPKTM